MRARLWREKGKVRGTLLGPLWGGRFPQNPEAQALWELILVHRRREEAEAWVEGTHGKTRGRAKAGVRVWLGGR